MNGMRWCWGYAVFVAMVAASAAWGASDDTEGLVDPPNPPGSAPVMLWPDLPYEGPVRDDLDAYGGWKGLQGTKTGFFHLEQVGGRWWFITPEGNVFFSLGVRDGAGATADQMRRWGFNALYVGGERPSTADEGLPYLLNLKFLRLAKGELPIPPRPGNPPWVHFPDVFDPEWPARCDEYAGKYLKPHANDPLMVGYWIENEPRLDSWYLGSTRTAPDSPARKAFVEIARAYYADKADQLAADWKEYNATRVEDLAEVQGPPPDIPGLAEMWEVAVAERTYSVIATAAKKVDPNHVNLGMRMISATPPSPAVLKVMGTYCDVLSLNLYSVLPDRLLTQIFTIVPAIHALAGRPIMVSEFSYRGGDTIHPNTVGAPPTVPTQIDRGIGYLSYVSAVASLPFFVGVNWYTYQDDPAEKQWEEYGEDCNFGIVDRLGRPYAALCESMRLTNASIYELAADPVQNKDCPLFKRTELMRWDRPWNKAVLGCYMGSENALVDPLSSMLPSDRRFHETYWVHHESPRLIVNDLRFSGNCGANIIRQLDDGQELAVFGVRTLTACPRSHWYGPGIENPEKLMALDTNAAIFVRRLDAQGRPVRVTLVDGSYVRINLVDMELRTNRKVPYLDLRLDYEANLLTITSRGAIDRAGFMGVTDWKAEWNGTAVEQQDIPAPEGMAVFAYPGT